MSAAILETAAVTMRFGGVVAVDAVDFSVAEGELRCVIGPNGAGKSTFFKCLTGQLKPTAGAIRFRGRSIAGLDSHRIARLGIGIKTQVPNVFDSMTVAENVLTASARAAASHATARRRAEEAMVRVGIADLAERVVGRLAHGQRQLVELAMVIAPDPDLILLDEPAAGMTDHEVAGLAELVVTLAKSNAVVLVEHDMQFIRRIARTVTVFNRGSILAEGPVEQIMADPQVRDVYLGETGGMTLLSVEGLHSGYQRIPIVMGVELAVAEGEFVGILGHNGMGKTTLMETLIGALPVTAGTIRFAGTDITRLRTSARARLGLGYVPQGRRIFPRLTVRENLAMAVSGKRRPDATVEEVLTDFPRLGPLLDRAGGVLSGGEQQILALARCLCGRPRLVLLDEPTEGIQPSIIDEMIEILLELRRRDALTMILVEQNLHFIQALSDRVLVLQRGRIRGEVTPEQVHATDLAASVELEA